MSVTSIKAHDAADKASRAPETGQGTTYKVNGGTLYFAVKRVFDVVFSAVSLVVLFIPMLFVSALIYIESPGPVIYSQERVGKKGKPFTMYKFRSMYLDAEKNGPQWAKKNDDRCTKIGRVIRLYHIDELPQLWNILNGDMSIVGPRPERAYFYDEFEKTIPKFRDRLLVKPGLTGLAQVNGGYDITPREKLDLDLEYISIMSLTTDIKCILKTFLVVFRLKGAR